MVHGGSLFLAFFFGFSPHVAAQEPNSRESVIFIFRQAVVQWDEEGLQGAVDGFSALLESDPSNKILQYWHSVASVHRCLYQLGEAEKDDKKQIEENLKSTRRSLVRLLESDPKNGEAHALMATLTGLRIAVSPWTGIARGPAVQRSTKRALKMEPENPRVHYLIGSNYLHGPSLLGGREKAKSHFLQAVKFYELERAKDREELAPQWGYSSCLFFLAQILQEEDNKDEAIAYLKQAHAVNPLDARVAEELERLLVEETGDE